MKRASVVVGVLFPALWFAACTRRLPPPMASGSATDVLPAVVPSLAAAPEDPPAPPAPDAPPAPETPPAPPPAPDAGSAERLLDDARRAAIAESEKRKALLEETLAAARRARDAGSLEEARMLFGRARELDPTNVEAREGWAALSTDRPSTTGDFFERTRREEVVRREAAAAEVQSYLRRGRALEAQQDFEGAIREYRAALAIVSWYANQEAFGVTSDSLKDLIDNTRAKAELKTRAENAEQIQRAQAARELDLAREREERLGRIRAYFREADLAYRRQEYALARDHANQVLREDPTNQSALNLIEITREAEHQTTIQENKQKFDDEWKFVFLQLERDILPQVRPVEWPEDWGRTAGRRKARVVGEIEVAGEGESKAAILATLEAKRVKGLVFQEANLDQVVAYLRITTGLNFHITPKVRSGKFEDVKVSMGPLDDVTVRQVLDIVTSTNALKWEPRNGVVTIMLPEEVAGRLQQRFFDVKDLAVKIQSFRGTEIYLAPSNYTPPEPPELAEPAKILDETALTEMIKSTIDPESWAIEGAAADVKNGQLIAKNTPENLDEIARLLERLRENSGPLVHLEVRFLTVEDNFLRDVGVDVRGLGDNSQGVGAPGLGTNAPQDDVFFGTPANPQGVPLGIHPEPSSVGTAGDSGIFYNDGQDGAYQARVENLFDTVLGNPNVLMGTGGLAFQHTFLDDTQMEVILRAVQKSERLQTITAAQTTVWNTQRATMEVLNKVAYVADYDVEIAQAANIANPIIKNAIDGVVLDVKPIVSADRRYVTLELRPTVATLVRPIPTFTTSLSSNIATAPVVIQTPKLQKSTVRTTVTMPDGGTLLLGGLKFYESVDATSEVPILGQLPVISFLFSRKGRYVNRRNVIVLITATVVALEEMEPHVGYAPPVMPLNEWTPIAPAPDVPPCECPPPPDCPPPAPLCAPPGPR
jgi:type II secretory pathway component GspD/PulD (secretin)/tetratricopeptide (TPR) repeat protein